MILVWSVTAPALIADEVEVLVLRLNSRWETRVALQRFADGLDSPDTDAVVAALMLAAGRGAAGASATLNALAESIQAWPDQKSLAIRVAEAGWGHVEWRNLSGGIVALHRAAKPA